MKDASKTKEELISELAEMRREFADLKTFEIERDRAAEMLKWEMGVNSAIAELASALVSSQMSIDDISSLVLEHAKGLTKSKYGYAGYIDPKTGYLVCPTMTRDVWDVCQIPDKDIVFKEFVGLWGWILDNQKPLLTNDPAADPRSSGTPPGHIPIHRVLSVPALVGEEPVGAISVANSERHYTEREQALLERLAAIYAIAVHRKRTEEEHLKLSRAVEQSPSTIVITDTDGNIEYVNPRFTQITGYSLEEVNGKNPRILKSGEMSHQGYNELWNTITSGGEWHGDFRNRKANGEFYWEVASISPIKNREGNITHFVKVAEDITALKRSEEELREQRDRLAELVEERTAELSAINEQLRINENSLAEAQRIAHFGNWDWDIVSNELRWSDEIYRIFGLTPQEFGATYETFLNSVHPDDRKFVDDSVNKALYENEPYSIDHRIVLPDNSERIVHEKAETFLDDTGQAIRMVGTVQDITERRYAEEKLEAQRVLSMRSDRLRSLGEMAAGIAHELNQPLVGVRGLAEHLLLSIDRGWELTNEKIRDRARLIIEQADRMVHIIEHIRIFARDAGKPELRPVHVNNVVKSSTDMLNTQFRSRGIELVCKLTDDLPVVSANPFSLEEVVINLLINARDATERQMKVRPGSTPPRIVLRTLLDQVDFEERVRIEVIDSGGGVPEHIIDKVFDPFFTTKGPDSGTGLGLSISRSIVEGFGGTIQIQSTTGSGTTVIISLPVGGPRSQEEQ